MLLQPAQQPPRSAAAKLVKLVSAPAQRDERSGLRLRFASVSMRQFQGQSPIFVATLRESCESAKRHGHRADWQFLTSYGGRGAVFRSARLSFWSARGGFCYDRMVSVVVSARGRAPLPSFCQKRQTAIRFMYRADHLRESAAPSQSGDPPTNQRQIWIASTSRKRFQLRSVDPRPAGRSPVSF